MTISHAHVWYRKSLCKIICLDKRKSKREKERERKKENSEVWVIKLKVITEQVFIHPHLEQKHPVVEFLHAFSLHNIPCEHGFCAPIIKLFSSRWEQNPAENFLRTYAEMFHVTTKAKKIKYVCFRFPNPT